jgi:hypothetical protein
MDAITRVLNAIEQGDPRAAEQLLPLVSGEQKARLVELRSFAGLTGDQAAAVLGTSPSGADRQWVDTRAWLRRELGLGAGPDGRFPGRGGNS